jgi:hypothetical protein
MGDVERTFSLMIFLLLGLTVRIEEKETMGNTDQES